MDKKSIILVAIVVLVTIVIQLASHRIEQNRVAAQTVQMTPSLIKMQPAAADPLFARPAAAVPSKSSLTIDTKDGKHIGFNVELARTQQDLELGLMLRKQMPETSGILFIAPSDRVLALWSKSPFDPLWMKNLNVSPLDMVFVSDDGRITRVASNAVPESDALVSSDIPVRAVIGLNGGVTAKLGIKPGDRIASTDLGTR